LPLTTEEKEPIHWLFLWNPYKVTNLYNKYSLSSRGKTTKQKHKNKKENYFKKYKMLILKRLKKCTNA